jgi:hypothetical protein
MGKQIRIWHDDVRPPPPNWVWAKTNPEVKRLFRCHEVVEMSLDHDLATKETGVDLVVWLCETGNVPGTVTIHSWNPVGAARMGVSRRSDRFRDEDDQLRRLPAR